MKQPFSRADDDHRNRDNRPTQARHGRLKSKRYAGVPAAAGNPERKGTAAFVERAAVTDVRLIATELRRVVTGG
jgi:hypothetical protein